MTSRQTSALPDVESLSEAEENPIELEARIKDHERRLEDIANDRTRTFRDAPQLGLANEETRRLLHQ